MTLRIYSSWSSRTIFQEGAKNIIYTFDFEGAVSSIIDCDLKIMQKFQKSDVRPDLYELIVKNPEKLAIDLLADLRFLRIGRASSALREMQLMGKTLASVKCKIFPGLYEFSHCIRSFSSPNRKVYMVTRLPLAVFYKLQMSLNIRRIFMKNYIHQAKNEDAIQKIRTIEGCSRKHVVCFVGTSQRAQELDVLGYTTILIDPEDKYKNHAGARISSYLGFTANTFREFLNGILG